MQGKSVRSAMVAIAASLAAAGCSGGSSVSQSVEHAFGIQESQVGGIVDLTSHHDQLGDVSGTTLTGQHLSLSSFRGKVLVVNFWGSWCAPCHEEEPAFVAVARRYAGKDVAFVGVAEKEQGTAEALAFEKNFHVPYPSLNDNDGTIELDFPTPAVPSTTPTTVLVGRTGQVLAKVSGPLDFTDLRSLVQHVLAEPT